MAKMYTIDNKLLTEKPEIRIGDKVYAVDDRKETFKKLTAKLEAGEKSAEDGDDEHDVIIKTILGAKAHKEIVAMDLSFAVTNKIVILIMAAVQDITEEEAEKRFQKAAH